jgi:hypothetical protein
MSGEELLKRWQRIKEDKRRLEEEEEKIKEKVRTVLKAKKINAFRTPHFKVTLRESSRESLAKRDCPPEVWARFCRVSKFDVLRLEHLGEEGQFDEVEPSE